jgi:hypothetical protein
MASSLDEWQMRLSQHFAQLREQRGKQPLFALEHGLDELDRDELARAVREQISSRPPSRVHSLAWICYAAEIGYGYSGDEYWQTFDLNTPGWGVRGDRGWLRERFEWFSDTYGGVAPRGPWASHFSIICWPITHAILPLDLQRQLARILYELRHSFSADLFESPTTLGNFIAARSWSATSRFQNIAEEPQLIGQIAAALLLLGEFGTSSLLHPLALKRISTDLERERTARGWLQTARKVAQERATVRGLSFARSGMLSPRAQPHEVRREILTLGVEPSIVLRPTDTVCGTWQVYLEIPDLSQLLLRFPGSRDVLTQSRCTVTGSAGRPLARGQCLFGSQQVSLKRWPRHDEVLIQFDKRDPQLEALFRTECLLRPGPAWLFRIASDGLAYEVRNQRVRPGQQYVFVRTGAVADPDLPPVVLDCEGVTGCFMSLPEALDARWESVLDRLGVRQSKSIEVWPAGLTPAQWDSDGHGEWLASEQPCLGIRADHSVTAIIVTVGNGISTPLAIDNLNPGSISFVELPQLPVGLHTIRFSTRRVGSAEVDPVGDLEVLMRIRESRPWSLNGGPQGPLLARIEPVNPTLEQLWEGRADIAFQGPTGRQLKCSVSLHDAIDGTVKSVQLPPLPLPVEPATWARHFHRHFQEQKGIADAYDTARSCELRFSADELGVFSFRTERESTPLRWGLRRTSSGYEVRLLNDSGAVADARIIRRSYELPQQEEHLPVAPAYAIPASGGLYVASTSTHAAMILAPPVIDGLSQLACNPVTTYSGDAASVLPAIWSDAELWTGAKPSGSMFSLTRQCAVRMAIHRQSIRLLCGNEWVQLEEEFRDGVKSLGYLQRGVWTAGHEAEVTERLRRNLARLSTADMLMRIREMAWIARFLEGPGSTIHESAFDWLGEFVLRVVSDSAEVRQWAAGRLDEGISYLLQNPTFVRAARFLVVATDRQLGSKTLSHELFASWRWR